MDSSVPESGTRLRSRTPLLTRGPWTSHEDANLTNAMNYYARNGGEFSWKSVSGMVGTRTAEQCKGHWMDKLDPSVDRGPWSDSELQWLELLLSSGWSVPDVAFIMSRSRGSIRCRDGQASAPRVRRAALAQMVEELGPDMLSQLSYDPQFHRVLDEIEIQQLLNEVEFAEYEDERLIDHPRFQ